MNSCTICMKEELKKEDIYTTDCNHMFCKKCLDDWFQRGNQTCPLCRSYIDTYIHKDENYKLIIHIIENNDMDSENGVADVTDVVDVATMNRLNITDLINHSLVVRNMVKQNLRLKLYSYTMVILFLYMLNNYLYSLQNINILNNDLDTCNLNNTELKDSLNTCLDSGGDYTSSGYYVSMFNGEFNRRCFYPLKFYNICFNK